MRNWSQTTVSRVEPYRVYSLVLINGHLHIKNVIRKDKRDQQL